MSLQNVIPRTSGQVGDIVEHSNGYRYEKSKNGKWKLLINRKLEKKILSLYRKGDTLRTVAKDIGIALSTAQGVINRNGLNCGKGARAKSDREILEKNKRKIISLYRSNWSFEQLAERYGILNYRVVGALIANEGIQRSKGEEGRRSIRLSYERGTSAARRKHAAAKATHSNRKSFTSFREYDRCARKLTNVILSDYAQIIDPKGIRSVETHVDHQYSIHSGWYRFSESRQEYVKRKRIVPLRVISHPANLKIMPSIENAVKGHRCAIDEDQLYRRIEKFELKHGRVFNDER